MMWHRQAAKMRIYRLRHRRAILSSKLICFAVFACLLRGIIPAQEFSIDEYLTGMTVVGKPGAESSCPPIVWKVQPDTPAAKAGIQPGDRLLAIDGHHGIDVEQARPFLHGKGPKPLTMELEGAHGTYTATVGLIKSSALYEQEGWKVGPDGGLYRKDATEAEMQRMSKTSSEPPASGKVFAGHYPSNLDLYYPGFEIFVWEMPFRTSIRGIEEGPADRAGIHYGDAVVSVNGVNPNGKSIDELEQLFSSPTPAKMTLVINRDGDIKTLSFELAKASDVAALNGKRKYQGRMIPSVIPETDLRCWNARAKKP
jgi:hypothetical protein